MGLCNLTVTRFPGGPRPDGVLYDCQTSSQTSSRPWRRACLIDAAAVAETAPSKEQSGRCEEHSTCCLQSLWHPAPAKSQMTHSNA